MTADELPPIVDESYVRVDGLMWCRIRLADGETLVGDSDLLDTEAAKQAARSKALTKAAPDPL